MVQAVADVPCALFAPELLQAYLDAQVILTERDPEGWVRSIESVFWYILRLRIWKVLEIVDTVTSLSSSALTDF